MFIIRDTKSGFPLSKHPTKEEAESNMAYYEDMMKNAGIYEEGQYEIEDESSYEILSKKIDVLQTMVYEHSKLLNKIADQLMLNQGSASDNRQMVYELMVMLCRKEVMEWQDVNEIYSICVSDEDEEGEEA